MRRILAIGDLHGGFLGLKQAMERANVSINDTLIFLGDYVDGWADTAELISYLIALNKTHNCIFIRGNHDSWFEEFLRYRIPNQDWVEHGGDTTLASYNNAHLLHEDNLWEFRNHIDFFYKMHTHYVDDKNRLFVHGGYTSESGVKGEYFIDRVYWDRTLYQRAYYLYNNCKSEKEIERIFPKKMKIYSEIFVGHTTTLLNNTDKPINVFNLWNLDTGAGTNGKVTIMDVDTKEFWQSDLLRELYPNDKHINFCNLYYKKLDNTDSIESK